MSKLSENKKNYLSDIREDIIDTKIKTIDEICLMFKYWLKAYFKSITTFGFDSIVTKDLNKIFVEYKQIRNRERLIHNYILKRGKNINLESDIIIELLKELDDINDETDAYYITVLSDIEEACDLKEAYRAKRIKKNFNTLIENDIYIKKLIEGCITFDDVIKFLKLPKSFIEFMNCNFKFYFLNNENTDKCDFYGINYKIDENNNIVDIKLFIPTITDLNTALINVHEIKRAYELYQRLGTKIDEEEVDEITYSARETQSSFKEYIAKKEKELLLK